MTMLWIIKCVCPYIGIRDFLHTGYGFKNLLASDSWQKMHDFRALDRLNRPKITKLWTIKCICPYMGIRDFFTHWVWARKFIGIGLLAKNARF